MPKSAAVCLAFVVVASAVIAALAGDASSLPPRIGVTVDAPAVQQPILVGKVVHVYDGDTIKVQLDSGPVIVRLHSIDTPEYDQPWGKQATAALARRVQGRKVSLAVVTQDSYDRLVADVFVGDENVNAWMVQRGNAWAYRHYLEDSAFCSWESEARESRRGLWGKAPDTWHAPWQWRAAGRGEPVAYSDYRNETAAQCAAAMPAAVHSSDAFATPASAGAPSVVTPSSAAPEPGNCLIKGNISSSGRIYHLPGSDSYDKTRIDESRGERWFCTENEARAAGWRPPGR